MSTHIEDQQVVVRPPMEGNIFADTALLLIAESGDNNCSQIIDRGGRQCEVRAKSWGAIVLGAGYEVMQAIVERAASCEGGMLKLAGRSSTLPETYIKRWRHALNEAVTVHVARRCGLTLDAAVVLKRDSFTDKYQLDAFDEIAAVAACEAVPEGTKFRFDLDHPLHVNALLRAYRLLGANAYAWQAVRIRGPRDARVHLAAAA